MTQDEDPSADDAPEADAPQTDEAEAGGADSEAEAQGTGGIAFLVGAGPGDPGLLTVRGLACLRRAEVVLYDRLVDPRILAEAPHAAKRVYVGKEPGGRAMPQEEINRLLVSHTRAGRRVVRLKGGDPFVFGRGGEEGEALHAAGLLFEVVPGITSGIAAPAYAGIPVTHRGLSTGLTLVTGHEQPGREETMTDWSALAKGGGTLSIYMGVGRAAAIQGALLSGGRPPEEPVAIIAQGTTPRQRTVVTTLADVARAVEREAIAPPAILLVGAVAGMRDALSWFEKRPLHGKAVAVTRARAQASALAERLAGLGAEVIEAPALRIVPLAAMDKNSPARKEAVTAARRLAEGGYDLCALTSVNGVDQVWALLESLGLDARAFGGTRLAAVGPGTAEALAARGLRADITPPRAIGEALAEAILEDLRARGRLPAAGESRATTHAPGKDEAPRILYLRAEAGRPEPLETLRQHGATVEDVTVYRTLPTGPYSDALRRRLLEGGLHAITFASGSAVRYFLEGMGDEAAQARLRATEPRCVSIGPVTSQALRDAGLPIAAEADPHTLDGLIQAVLTLG